MLMAGESGSRVDIKRELLANTAGQLKIKDVQIKHYKFLKETIKKNMKFLWK